MTREEAAKIFEPYLDNDCYTERFREACRMAISALKGVEIDQFKKRLIESKSRQLKKNLRRRL